mgnify:CR=1 FL=1
MELTEFVKKCRLYLFDMDGTLYLGNRLYPFTIEMLETIKAHGAKYMFVTNNSSKSVNDYIKKLAKLGITAEYDDFLTSSQATAFYLKKTVLQYMVTSPYVMKMLNLMHLEWENLVIPFLQL